VTPLEIQQKEFAVARFGGYKMRDVDEFLDELTESVGALVSENERLRRRTGDAPVVGSPDLDDVARQADEIIQRAREEAGRIVAEANEQAASIAGSLAAGEGGGGEAVQAFLAQERVFLQSLAGLVQGHVDSAKGMARPAVDRKGPSATPPRETQDTRPASTVAASETVDAGVRAEGADVPAAPDADATQVVPEADAPIRADEPERTGATVTTTKPSGGDDGEDSLRELFWGEEG
jgi:DivIVA domain-containing protein